MIRSGVPGKLGRIRLKGDALANLRHQCWIRDKERCVDCGKRVREHSFEMAHIKARGVCGSDSLDNVVTKCGFDGCHWKEHNPKSVQKKGVKT